MPPKGKKSMKKRTRRQFPTRQQMLKALRSGGKSSQPAKLSANFKKRFRGTSDFRERDLNSFTQERISSGVTWSRLTPEERALVRKTMR